MFKYYSSYILVLGGFTHLLCCGIPVFLGLSSIFTNLIYIEFTFLNFELLEIAENYLFTLTSLIFFMLISQEFYNRKIKCANDDDCCSQKECDSTKKRIKFNLIVSLIFYFFNIFFFNKITYKKISY